MSMSKDPDELLTVDESAAEVKKHPQTIRTWAKTGQLQAYRIGRSVRIKRSDLTAAMVDYRQ